MQRQKQSYLAPCSAILARLTGLSREASKTAQSGTEKLQVTQCSLKVSGTYTVMRQVPADALGLPPRKLTCIWAIPACIHLTTQSASTTMSNPGGEVLLAKWGDGAAYTYAEVAAIPTRPGSLTIARGGSAEISESIERANALKLFAANLHKAFFGFEPDFFQHNLLRLVDEAAHVIKGSIELWPTLIEICFSKRDARACRNCE
jgi:hypothetical protein